MYSCGDVATVTRKRKGDIFLERGGGRVKERWVQHGHVLFERNHRALMY
jgi:hypothetical protein